CLKTAASIGNRHSRESGNPVFYVLVPRFHGDDVWIARSSLPSDLIRGSGNDKIGVFRQAQPGY
ncbi:hypothetical protein LM599_04300, partial [Candidatus Acetothermia bacterium]|nr:hypothetical protein [Candidatus Acetothermia bacterium]